MGSINGLLSLHEGLRVYPTGSKYSTPRNEFNWPFEQQINNDISTANFFTAKSNKIMFTCSELGMDSEQRVNGIKMTNMTFNEVRQDVTTQNQSTISATNLNLLH